MKKIDLHIHTVSTVSDHPFDFSMEVLKDYIETKKLDAIAITNHNIFNCEQYKEISKELSIPVFPGIEIDIEQGHLLLITSREDIMDFIPRCKKIHELNSTNTSWIKESQLIECFPNPEKYILIPHYDKKPKLDFNRIPKLREYITCGEAASEKKFLSMKKNQDEVIPVLFSDERMERGLTSHSDRQTYIDIEEITISSIKQALRDYAKVALSPNEGNIVFPVLENGLKISTGLTVVLGGRSSGKSFTLDAINQAYEHAEYIKQFELLARDVEADQKRFDDLLRRKGDSIAEEFLTPFKYVIDDVEKIDLHYDEREIESYLNLLKKSASEVERKDAFAKARIFGETLFDVKDLTSLEKLISAVDILIDNKEYRSIIENSIDRKALLELAISLRKKYILEQNKSSQMEYINDIVSNIKEELGTRTTNTIVPDIDFYRILMNKKKVNLFCDIVDKMRQRRTIEQKSVYSFRIVATARAFRGAKELHDVTKTKESLQPAFLKYQNPYSYLEELKSIVSIPTSEHYKFFVCIDYEVLNQYGTKASGGERSEYNLLQRLRDALKEDILILDEPESSFDNIFLKEGVDSLLKDLSTQIPVVIATHNNTIGASVHPDFIIYTQKEVLSDGNIKYHVYSGYPSSAELIDLDGNSIERRKVLLDCLEAGEQAYRERSTTYEISLH